MKKRIGVTVVVFLCSCLFCLSGFSQYSFLVRKWAQLHGPAHYEYLGVALQPASYKTLSETFRQADEKDFNKLLLEDFQILRVYNNTSVIVETTEIFEGRAKVIIFSGLYKGMSGWVPLEWLDNNDARPQFSDLRFY